MSCPPTYFRLRGCESALKGAAVRHRRERDDAQVKYKPLASALETPRNLSTFGLRAVKLQHSASDPSVMLERVDASWKVRGGHPVPGPVGESARLLIAGDTHGNLDWIRTLCKLAARHRCQGVVQLGDFGFWPDQQIWRSELRLVINDRWLDAVAATAARHNVWLRVIDGNHDAHPLARSAYAADENGVRPIRSGVLDWADRGSVWEWCGRRFAALGGAVSPDKEWRRPEVSWWATEEITPDELQALIDRASGKPVDVLLTHDASRLPPGMRELSNPILAAACRRSNLAIEAAADALHPVLHLHGHLHHAYTRQIEREWGSYTVVGLSSDEEAADPYGGPWCILELPSLRILARTEL